MELQRYKLQTTILHNILAKAFKFRPLDEIDRVGASTNPKFKLGSNSFVCYTCLYDPIPIIKDYFNDLGKRTAHVGNNYTMEIESFNYNYSNGELTVSLPDSFLSLRYRRLSDEIDNIKKHYDSSNLKSKAVNYIIESFPNPEKFVLARNQLEFPKTTLLSEGFMHCDEKSYSEAQKSDSCGDVIVSLINSEPLSNFECVLNNLYQQIKEYKMLKETCDIYETLLKFTYGQRPKTNTFYLVGKINIELYRQVCNELNIRPIELNIQLVEYKYYSDNEDGDITRLVLDFIC